MPLNATTPSKISGENPVVLFNVDKSVYGKGLCAWLGCLSCVSDQ